MTMQLRCAIGHAWHRPVIEQGGKMPKLCPDHDCRPYAILLNGSNGPKTVAVPVDAPTFTGLACCPRPAAEHPQEDAERFARCPRHGYGELVVQTGLNGQGCLLCALDVYHQPARIDGEPRSPAPRYVPMQQLRCLPGDHLWLRPLKRGPKPPSCPDPDHQEAR